MTTRNPAQCSTCVHWVPGIRNDGVQSCTAFPLPAGIPDDIWWNESDHRQPHAGDRGIQWESRDGAEYPEWALTRALTPTPTEEDEVSRRGEVRR